MFYFYLISVLYLTGPISPCCRLSIIMVLLTQSIFEVFLQRRKTGIYLALTGCGGGEISLEHNSHRRYLESEVVPPPSLSPSVRTIRNMILTIISTLVDVFFLVYNPDISPGKKLENSQEYLRLIFFSDMDPCFYLGRLKSCQAGGQNQVTQKQKMPTQVFMKTAIRFGPESEH